MLIEKLKAIRALIDKPEKWTREALARDKDGNEVYYANQDAACYSLAGADMVISPKDTRAYDALVDALPDGFRILSAFNDHPDTTHADVLALVDRAIAAEQVS